MASDPTDTPRSNDSQSSDDAAVDALHRIELGLEWFHRAHGHLVAFHHNTGHAMDHFAAAEELLREQGETELADALRDEFLPCGVLGDRWSYDVLETFQDGLLDDADAFEERARHRLTDGNRHVAERRQERDWKGRASGWKTDGCEEGDGYEDGRGSEQGE